MWLPRLPPWPSPACSKRGPATFHNPARDAQAADAGKILIPHHLVTRSGMALGQADRLAQEDTVPNQAASAHF